MTDEETRKLARAAIPLEVLCGQIRTKPYKEIDDSLQSELQNSLEIIRNLLGFSEENPLNLLLHLR